MLLMFDFLPCDTSILLCHIYFFFHFISVYVHYIHVLWRNLVNKYVLWLIYKLGRVKLLKNRFLLGGERLSKGWGTSSNVIWLNWSLLDLWRADVLSCWSAYMHTCPTFCAVSVTKLLQETFFFLMHPPSTLHPTSNLKHKKMDPPITDLLSAFVTSPDDIRRK